MRLKGKVLNMQKDMLFWIWLSDALGAACRDFKRLISLYDNAYEIFYADSEELERIDGISSATCARLSKKNLERATAILDACERLEIGVLPYADPAYPNALRELSAPPVLLYCRGTLPNFQKRLSIGMVGTRRMSAYGMQTAYKIAYELAAVGTVIVSGMAAGIDGVCAAAALAAKGTTVAVLGCGLDVVYPRHHKRLMNAIVQNGVLLSEYPPGTLPNRYHFPTRNRLISGLSQGTVVVEAGLGSGSLITAKDAIVQGRDVFAFPANVNSRGAEGTNGLLRDGANLVLGANDILAFYQYLYAETLRTELLAQAQERSKADLRYLESLGVIELTEKKTDESASALRAVAATPKEPVSKSETRGAAVPAKQKAVREPNPERKVEQKARSHVTPDGMLSSLTPIQLAVLQAIPDDRAVTVDHLAALGYPNKDLIATLTMLEILGLIQKLPGALYTKS